MVEQPQTLSPAHFELVFPFAQDRGRLCAYKADLDELDRLIAAIMSSGRGTKEEPWVVIAPEHEYNIINFLGFVATDHETLDGGIDYIKVQPVAGKNTEGFYFDISRMMQIAALKFPDI